MNPNLPADRDAFLRATGFTVIAMSMDDYAPLARDLTRIVNDRLAKVPWIPPTVISQVDPWIGRQDQGMYWVAIPVSSAVNRPTWLDTPEKISWWTSFTNTVQRVRLAYGTKILAAGQVAMDSAYFDSKMWDIAYKIDSVLASPVTFFTETLPAFAGKTGDKALSSFLSSTTGKLVVAGGVAFVAYKLGVFDMIRGKLAPKARTNPGRRRKRKRS